MKKSDIKHRDLTASFSLKTYLASDKVWSDLSSREWMCKASNVTLIRHRIVIYKG